MIWHGWPEDKRYSTLEGTKELADIYNEANNQVLLDSVDQDIFFEIDTYWVKVAGHDPAKIVGEFGKRAPLLHIKDGPARWNDSLPKDNPEPMVAVGKGTQNFPAVVKAANGIPNGRSLRWM